MTSLTALADCLHNGILLIQHAATLISTDDAGTHLDDLFDPDEATALRRLATIYYGDTSFTGYQRQAIAAAATQRHSIHDLLRIEHHTRRLRISRHAWALRTHLCGVAGENIDAEARSKLKELLPAPAPKRLGVTHYRGTNGNPDTLIYRGPSLEVTRLRDFLDQPDDAVSVFINAATSAAADSNALTGTTAYRYNLGDSRNTTPDAAPHIILTLDDVITLQHQHVNSSDDGDNDVLLTLTNGARITGAEWAALRLHEIGFVTLLHPVEGPVNLYRTSRFPNLKQRLMAAAEHPLCAWPGCRQAASRSHIHHLTAWKHGGDTNAKNLTVLCAYHNGINNDAPPQDTPVHTHMINRATPLVAGARKTFRGRMERRPGGVVWVPDEKQASMKRLPG